MPKSTRVPLPSWRKTCAGSLSPIQQHKQDWKGCTGCFLHESRHSVVLCRGTYPCQVVFVGEAPGPSEDVTGFPFDGPAGHLLDVIIQNSIRGRVSYALTNLICCIPISAETGKKVDEPDAESVEACTPRLQEFIAICDPDLLVAVGKHAKAYLESGFKHTIKFHKPIPVVHIHHPAYMLRANIAQRGLLIQEAEIVVRNAVEQYTLGI